LCFCHRSNKASINPLSPIDGATLLPFYVVGNEQGFFPQVQPPMTTLQMGPAERYDLVVDFTSKHMSGAWRGGGLGL
jgi:FtsP/CotA-like multicopper oxidase with cupredoxin domain